MARTDFLLGEDGDLQIVDGDLLTGESDDQNVALILKATKGSIKQFPLLGVGIALELNGLIDGRVKRNIRLHLDSDGYKVIKFEENNGVNSIKYEDNNGAT